MWLFVLFFGLFAPRALADFAVCQPSWGWVSDLSGLDFGDALSHQGAIELIHDLSQANNSLNQNPCQVAGALEAECEGFCVFESPFYIRFDR